MNSSPPPANAISLIPSVPNLRDAGNGYATIDGGRVRIGLLYRSASLHRIGDDDLTKLEQLGLKTVYDLRTEFGVKLAADRLPSGVNYVRLDVLKDSKLAAKEAELQGALADPKSAGKFLRGVNATAIMQAIYRELVSLASARASYGQLFSELAEVGRCPALFHCDAGKDRTGWANVALLTLLGVPYEIILEDYLRSGDLVLPTYAKLIQAFSSAGGDQEILLAIFGVRAEYLRAAFDEMQLRHGSIKEYFSQGLGIEPAAQQALRELFVEKK